MYRYEKYLNVFLQSHIVTKLMEWDLHTFIIKYHNLDDEKISLIVYQILRGLKYIHSCNIIHRDLKPGNVLVDKNLNVKVTIRILKTS